MKNSYKLLGIIQDYAPDAAAQQRVSKIYNDMFNEKEDVVVKVLAGILYDGLAYGNWPWNIKK